MSDEGLNVTGGTELGKSVSSGRVEVRDSQGVAKPAYLQQPDVIAIPPAPPQGQGNSQAGATQSVVNNDSSSKGE